jgi:hypothetical protein
MRMFHFSAPPPMSRFGAALVAGAVAIMLNTVALKGADLFHLATAHGGLLRLLTSQLSGPLARLGVSSLWSALHGPPPRGVLFQTGFHLVAGIILALFYAFVLEPMLPPGSELKGWCYAVGLWIINAAIVLPATGDGFAGSATLSPEGIIWFAACHTLFCLVLAYGFARLTDPPTADGTASNRPPRPRDRPADGAADGR